MDGQDNAKLENELRDSRPAYFVATLVDIKSGTARPTPDEANERTFTQSLVCVKSHEHHSMIMLELKGSGPDSEVKVMFTSRNATDFSIKPITKDTIGDGAEHCFAARLVKHDDLQSNATFGPKWWCLRLEYHAKSKEDICAAGLFGQTEVGAAHESTVEWMRGLFGSQTETRSLAFVFRGSGANKIFQGVFQKLATERGGKDPLAAWYDHQKGIVRVQWNEVLRAESRPKKIPEVRDNFWDMNNYVVYVHYALVQSQEYEDHLVGDFSMSDVGLRTMKLPGAGDRRLYGFCEIPSNVPLQLQHGARVDITFDQTDETYPKWPGTVQPALPFSPANCITLTMTRPLDEDGSFEVEDPAGNPLSPVDPAKYQSIAELRDALQEATVNTVNVGIQTSTLATRRQVAALERLRTDPAKANLWRAILANRPSTLPTEDAYGNLSNERLEVVTEMSVLNHEQCEAIRLLRGLQGGIGLWYGPPGTGKTTTIFHCALPFMKDLRPAGPGPVFITTSANHPVSDFAKRAHDIARRKILDRPAIVLRLHAEETEYSIFEQDLPVKSDDVGKTRTSRQIFQWDPNQDLTETQRIIRDSYQRANSTGHEGVTDRRVVFIELSVGRLMKDIMDRDAQAAVAALNSIESSHDANNDDDGAADADLEPPHTTTNNNDGAADADSEPLHTTTNNNDGAADADSEPLHTTTNNDGAADADLEPPRAAKIDDDGAADADSEPPHTTTNNDDGASDDEPETPASPMLHLRQLYDKIRDDPRSVGENQIKVYRELRKELFERCIREADIVACTLAAFATPAVQNCPTPLIVVDEANQARETDMMGVLAHHSCHRVVLVGDHKQLPPTVLEPAPQNNWAPQLGRSMFERLIHAGHARVMLREQYRMVEPLADPVSTHFYDGELRTHPTASTEAPDRRERVTALATFNNTEFGVESPAIFVNVTNGEAFNMEGTTSKCNIQNVSLVVEKLAALMGQEVMRSREIAIITGYAGQVAAYNSALAEASRQPEPGFGNLARVKVGTIDSFEGAESPFVVMDTVVTDRIGFMSDANRINVALSRAKWGMWMVGSIKTLVDGDNGRNGAGQQLQNVVRAMWRDGRTTEPQTVEIKLFAQSLLMQGNNNRVSGAQDGADNNDAETWGAQQGSQPPDNSESTAAQPTNNGAETFTAKTADPVLTQPAPAEVKAVPTQGTASNTTTTNLDGETDTTLPARLGHITLGWEKEAEGMGSANSGGAW